MKLRLFLFITLVFLIISGCGGGGGEKEKVYKIVFDREENGIENIYAINSDGTGFQKLTNNTDPEIECYNPSISPDGQKVLFKMDVVEEDEDGNISYDDFLWVVNIDGTELTQLLPSRGVFLNPSWSPDGNKVIVRDYYREGELSDIKYNVIAVIDLETKQWVSDLVKETEHDFDFPSWSPSGDKIVYENREFGNPDRYSIWVLNLDSNGQPSGSQKIADNYLMPAWSADGNSIIVCDGTNLLLISPSDGSVLKRFSTGIPSSYPCYSPDGKKIVFCAWVSKDEVNIYIMNSDGSNIKRLTSGGCDYNPSIF